MEPTKQEFRRNLIEQLVPEPGRLDRYRKEMTKMLDENERGLRREKRMTVILWLFAVTMMTAFLLMSGLYHPTPERVWFASLTSFAVILLYGAIEIVKHFINRARVELLKELKQIELRLLELDERLRSRA
jgi:hypothetical protein